MLRPNLKTAILLVTRNKIGAVKETFFGRYLYSSEISFENWKNIETRILISWIYEFWLIGKRPRYNIDVHFDFKYVPQEYLLQLLLFIIIIIFFNFYTLSRSHLLICSLTNRSHTIWFKRVTWLDIPQPKLQVLRKNIWTAFLGLRSRKTVRFSEQIMYADKYPSKFSRQMEAIVYL